MTDEQTMAGLAVVFTGAQQMEVRQAESPALPKAGQVLLDTRCTLISTGTECTVYGRRFSEGTHWHAWVKYPFYPGYCGVGTVLDVGEGVEGVAVGQRVVTRSNHARPALGPASQAVLIPDEVSDEQAAWMPMGVIAQHGFRKAELQLGESVVIVGLGMLGQLLVQYARLAGADRIIGIDPVERRLALAEQHGATDLIAAPVEQARDEVCRITHRKMTPVLFDSTGSGPVFVASQKLVAPFGRMVLLGDCGKPEQQHLTTDLLTRNITLLGAHEGLASKQGPWDHKAMGQLFMQWLAEGRIDVQSLISHRFAATDAQAAYDLLMNHREEAMGVILDFTEV